MHTQIQAANELISRDERRTFESDWRAYVATCEADAPAFLLQALIRGRDPKRGFTPVTNAAKLGNGQWAWQGYEGALFRLRYNPSHFLRAIWPSLGATRFDAILSDLTAKLDLLKTEA